MRPGDAGAFLDVMKRPSPPPAGGGKPFPKFSHPPWHCLGSGWSWTSTPVPSPLTHSVTWVGRRKKDCFSLPPPSPNTLWDYSSFVILGLTLLHLLFSLHPTASTGGVEMPARCWSEQRGMPSPPQGEQRGWIWGDGEPKGCLSPSASQAWLRGCAQPSPR